MKTATGLIHILDAVQVTRQLTLNLKTSRTGKNAGLRCRDTHAELRGSTSVFRVSVQRWRLAQFNKGHYYNHYELVGCIVLLFTETAIYKDNLSHL